MSTGQTDTDRAGGLRDRLREARLYVCTDTRRGQDDLRVLLEACVAGGVDVLQLRDKTATAQELREAAAVFREICGPAGVLFVLNDLPGLAVEVGADGVHVGQADIPPRHVRSTVGDRLLIGRSTHSIEQVEAAADEPVDYLSVGPVHTTPTKQGRPAAGLEPVRHAAATLTRPWFAIGGVSRHTLPAVQAAGATRVVVVRAVVDAPDPGQAARQLRRAVVADLPAGGSEHDHGRGA